MFHMRMAATTMDGNMERALEALFEGAETARQLEVHWYARYSLLQALCVRLAAVLLADWSLEIYLE